LAISTTVNTLPKGYRQKPKADLLKRKTTEGGRIKIWFDKYKGNISPIKQLFRTVNGEKGFLCALLPGIPDKKMIDKKGTSS